MGEGWPWQNCQNVDHDPDRARDPALFAPALRYGLRLSPALNGSAICPVV